MFHSFTHSRLGTTLWLVNDDSIFGWAILFLRWEKVELQKRCRILQYFHIVNELFMDLEVHIIAPFETDNDLCFVNANGLLKTLCVLENAVCKNPLPMRNIIEIIQIYHMTQHPVGPPWLQALTKTAWSQKKSLFATDGSLFLDLFCLNGKGRREDERKHSLLFWLALLLRFIRTDIKVQEWNADRHKIHRGIKHSLLKLHNIETLPMLVLIWWPLTPQDRGLLPDPTVTPHMLSAPSTRDVTYGQSIYERHLFLWGAIYSNSTVNSEILSTKYD